MKTMTSGMWYRVLVEENVTYKLKNSGRELVPCRIESKHPELNWERAWSLAVTPGLPSSFLTFLWRMLHDLLPCQTRLFRLRMPNANSDICTLCDLNVAGDLTHSLMLCTYNGGVGQFLLTLLHHVLPTLLPHQVTLLDLEVDQKKQLPLVYIIASVLSQVWDCRKEKKPYQIFRIRAVLEAGVNIMRKSRHWEAAVDIISLLETT